MQTILLIHGPNLNMLGVRDRTHYGTLTLAELLKFVSKKALEMSVKIKAFQSNSEGALIDFIQKNAQQSTGIIINPGALTHYSFSLHDALLDACVPAVEVHLSDISKREPWRRESVTAEACIAQITGKKEKGYIQALEILTGRNTTAIIGFPLGHTLSPILHNAIYKAFGINAEMRVIAGRNVKKLVEEVKRKKISLTCVTIPHKKTIMKFLDRIDPLAKEIGAVNTVVAKNGELTGYNTDIVGVSKALKNVDIKRKRVLILGAGGAANTMAFFIRKEGGEVRIAGRDTAKARSLARRIGGTVITTDDLREKSAKDFDVIINATPVGMHPNAGTSPLDKRFFRKSQTVFDLIYNPPETEFLRQAKAKGAKTINGLAMFLPQAQEQIELWSNKKIPAHVMAQSKKLLTSTL